jgi:hypothetical protein
MYFLQLLLCAKSKWNWQAWRFLHRYKRNNIWKSAKVFLLAVALLFVKPRGRVQRGYKSKILETKY